MASRFQHQDQLVNYGPPRSAAAPQHGQKTEKPKDKVKEPRSFNPRPAH